MPSTNCRQQPPPQRQQPNSQSTSFASCSACSDRIVASKNAIKNNVAAALLSVPTLAAAPMLVLLLLVLLSVMGPARGQPAIANPVPSAKLIRLPASRQQHRRAILLLINKKSDTVPPQWEDLGWAWGKKRSGQDWLAANKPAEVGPQWDDLGWSWKKRSGGGRSRHEGEEAARETLIGRAQRQLRRMAGRGQEEAERADETAGEAARDQTAEMEAAALGFGNKRSAVVKPANPDWHDLGWAWGRRK